MPPLSSSSTNFNPNPYICEGLSKHLFFSKLLPILPVESALRTCQEVEEQGSFLHCRSIAICVAISRDLNPILENAMDLIDELLGNEASIISQEINEDTVQSILIVTRLITDVMEYYWKSKENNSNNSNYNCKNISIKSFEKQEKSKINATVGFATNRPSFHNVTPGPLDPAIATRIANLSTRIKLHSKTFTILKNMALYNPSNNNNNNNNNNDNPDISNSNYYGFNNNIMPSYKKYLEERGWPSYADKIDTTIDYMLKFVSASNPNEFIKYAQTKIITPLIINHIINESNVVQYLDIFGSFYLTHKNIGNFLELVKKISSNMRKTVYHVLFLHYTSKSFLFWIMERPKEYIQLYQNLLHYDNENTDPSIKEIPNTISVLFDNIYSDFNISQYLTSLNETNNNNDSPNHNNNNSNSLKGSVSSINYHTTDKFTTESPMPILIRNPTSYSMSSSSEDHSIISSSLHNSNDPQKNYTSKKEDLQNFYPFSIKIENPETTNKKFGNTYESTSHSLVNVLELYTNFSDINLISYQSILQFLSMLLFLDTEVFMEINSMKFKHLRDATVLSNDLKDNNSINHTSSTSNFSTTPNNNHLSSPTSKRRGNSMSPTSYEDRTQSIKHLTYNLKRFTSLTSSSKKSKQTKFLILILKNINGVQLACDSSLIDSISTILTILTMASSISMYNSKLPCIQFAKRLYAVMGTNLSVGEDWNAMPNKFLIYCLDRHPTMKKKLQLEYFACVLQLEPDEFLKHLHLDKELNFLDLEKLSIYVEGFRIFFHLREQQPITKQVAKNVSKFFKTLFYKTADLLLKEFPYFDESVTDVIISILDGSILDKFEKTSTLSTVNVSTERTPSEYNNSDASSTISSNSKTISYQDNKTLSSSWDVESILLTNFHGIKKSDLNSNENQNNDNISETININTTDQNSTSLKPHTVQTEKHIPLSLPSDKLTSNSSRISTRSPSNSVSIHNLTFSNVTKKLLSSRQNIQSVSSSTKAPSRKSSSETLAKAIPLNNLSSLQPVHSNNSSYLGQLSSSSLEHIKDADNDYAQALMMIIFSIFKRVTNYFILPSKDIDAACWTSKEFKNIIKPIFVGVMDKNIILQHSAQSFVDVLTNYIEDECEDAQEDQINEFYVLSSYTITLFSAALFDRHIDSPKRLAILKIIIKFLSIKAKLRKIAAKSRKSSSIIKIEASIFPIVATTLGAGLFTSLFCNTNDFANLLKDAYSYYYNDLKFYRKYVGKINSVYLYNIDFIKTIATDDFTASGSVAFQRRLKNNIVKYIKFPDSVILEAMNALYNKWLGYSKLKVLTQKQLNDFKNIAGILAAISGVFLTTSPEALIGFKKFPYLDEMRKDITEKIDYFIKLQCIWLNDSELLIREIAKDLLSIELHPLSYGILFKNIKVKIDELSTIDLTLPDQELSYILLEQMIIIIRTILKRDDDNQIIIWYSLQLINSITDIIKIVQKIDHKSIRYYKAIIQMSKMFNSLEYSEEFLCIKNHFALKNKWIKLVISWFEETLNKNYDFENISKSHRDMDLKKRDLDILYIDTSIESSKALAYLTKDVPLEVSFANTKEEMKRSASVVFGNYFTILLKGLEKSTNLDEYPAALKHRISLLNSNLITALTNLSIANVDSSFQFTLPMGYSKDKNIKIAFLKVFTDITNNYPFQESSSKSAQQEAVSELTTILLKYPKFVYLGSLVCPSAEIDAYAVGVINAFETMNAGHIVVLQLITSEIHNATKYLDVLRRNSCATRALSIYARAKGNSYLIRTLRPTLQELINKKDYFDIDKPTQEIDIKKSVKLFLSYLDKLTNAIVSSISYFPSELRLIFQTIYREMKNKFPHYAYLSIGSFVFLRFLGPALVSPDSENIEISFDYECKKSFLILAKVIQNMANGSDDFTKWPALQPHAKTLKIYNDRISGFIKNLCDTDEVFKVPEKNLPTSIYFDYHFIHKFLYEHELEIRAEAVNDVHFSQNFEALKDFANVIDGVLKKLGLPMLELSHDLPPFVKENMEKYPQLYEFMKRHAFKSSVHNVVEQYSPVQESMSSSGVPILIISYRQLAINMESLEDSIYKILRAYTKVWSNKHCLVLDCTNFATKQKEFKKICIILFSLLPDIVFKTCIKVYYINTTDIFMKIWTQLRVRQNPFMTSNIPYEFLNTSTDQLIIKGLGLTSDLLQSLENTRISLHDIELYDEEIHKFFPVTLKIGYKDFQILHEVPKVYDIHNLNKSISVLLNDVFSLIDISVVNVSNVTGRQNEFTVSFFDGNRLIFSNNKYLEIIKMFYYAESKVDNNCSVINSEMIEKRNKNKTNRDEIIAHLCLVILVGLFSDDESIKNISYNLLVSTQNAFHLNFGTVFYHSLEVYVPQDTTMFLSLISQSLCTSSPELTPYIWKYIVDGLEKGVVNYKAIPTVVTCLSYWIPNMYDSFFNFSDLTGPEVFSHIIQSLIRLTFKESDFTAVYMRQIWYKFAVDVNLAALVVDEVINHALERDSENREWNQVITLLTGFPTVEVTSQVLHRFMNVIKILLPSLTLESYNHSWSELNILSNISIPLFFESSLLTQMYLPELLYVISLLIDTGPSGLRLTLHKLLMNICHSLTVNESLDNDDREHLLSISTAFSHQKLNLISGFSQEKGKWTSLLNTTSFTSKVNSLETFTSNIILLMEFSSKTEASFWKTKFKKYILDAIFNYKSFLSARAMMILGVMSKKSCSEALCRDLLSESMQIFAIPKINEETMFLHTAHTFALAKLVEGIDPTLPIMKEMFWLATSLIGSPHPVVFEGALIFVTNCLRKLYSIHFESYEKRSLPSILLTERKFAKNLLDEIDQGLNIEWTCANFPHIISFYIIRSLSIPVMKGTTPFCLKLLFNNSFKEYSLNLNKNHYLVYLYLLYMLSSPEEFQNILQEVSINEKLIKLDSQNKIPLCLADWISGHSYISAVAFYQSAKLFSLPLSDEPCKYRFLLIVKYLLEKNPERVFTYYLIIRKELRRISSLEEGSELVLMCFDIINLLIARPEFDQQIKDVESYEKLLEEHGLKMLTDHELLASTATKLNNTYRYKADFLYQRKRLITMILGKMTNHNISC